MQIAPDVLSRILHEREEQREKWGDYSDHEDSYWLGILMEEVGEVAKEITEGAGPEAVRRELVQVAAVTIAWLESRDCSYGGAE